ncbi:hypothetical protein AB1N83_013772 [Pleurotus pulmonarius]|nr:hypothetical protein EYR38_007183 [Pleurotus pulmonarius]
MAPPSAPVPTPREALEAELHQARSKQKGQARGLGKKNKENTAVATGAEDTNGDGAWGAEENHPYTDKLLTIIEDSFHYRQAFGFAIGDTPPVTSGGHTLISLAQEIAGKLWPGRVIVGKKVPLSVKNRITNLKRTYSAFRAKLGETGHGLIVAGQEDKIVTGTPISNVFESMTKKFPWYSRLHLLLSVSPVYDRSALANSTTPVDLSVLSTAPVAPVMQADPASDAADEDQVDGTDNQTDGGGDAPDASTQNSFHSGFSFDDDQDLHTPSSPSNPSKPSTPFRPHDSPAVSSTPASLSTPAKVVPQKRKHVLDHVRELSESAQATRLKVAEVKASAKRLQAAEKAQHAFRMEEMRIKAVAERERQHQEHERAMMQMQLQIALINSGQAAGVVNQGMIDPNLS